MERWIAEEVRAGRYDSPEAVVAEAIHLLDHTVNLLGWTREELDREIDKGLSELERGEGLDGEEVFEELLGEAGSAKSHAE
ncbi:MAG: type II toxin-antitoxin system ParD family antitoxin [Candidatus Methylomirabilis sp.]|nr:type II toxin-antitoxin system ParD family antitoxin [Deltaproteobacteria bacterium]